jgi:hypothetical protein
MMDALGYLGLPRWSGPTTAALGDSGLAAARFLFQEAGLCPAEVLSFLPGAVGILFQDLAFSGTCWMSGHSP